MVRSRSLVPILLAILTAVGGCGTAAPANGSERTIPEGYPTVASERFHGAFEAVSVRAEGEVLTLEVPPMIVIDVVTGGVEAGFGCNQYLGSYTLADDGVASFTFAGGTSEQCPGGRVVEQTLLAVFERVDRWEDAGGGFTVTSPVGDRVELRRIEGT